MSFEGGPFVQFACFCEMVLEDKTSAFSLIRIIDTITQSATGPEPPQGMPSFGAPLNLAIGLKSGKAIGRHELIITPERPNGSTLEQKSMSIHFEGEEKGCNVFLKMNIIFDMEGLYIFHIQLGEERITAIPLRVKYQRMMLGFPQSN